MTEPEMPLNNQTTLSSDGLKRTISVWGLSANIVNIVVGTGIFVLPAIVAAGLGSAGLIAYLFCGLLIALIMLCFAEAGSEVTDSGGPYTYIESAFGKYAGFMTANLFLIAYLAGGGAVANAVADILAAFIPLLDVKPVRIFFFLIMFGFFAWINIRGVRLGIGLVIFTTIAKLIPLLLLVLIGWKDVIGDNLLWESIPDISSIGQISLVLFFAFTGAEVGLSVGGEVKEPQKTFPRAILIGITGVLVIYTLIQAVSVGVLGNGLASYPENPLAEVGGVVFGPIGITLITVGAAVSAFGNLNGGILNLPRVLFAAARDRVIPPAALARVHPEYKTPHISILVFTAIIFLMASMGGFQVLAIATSAISLLVYLGVVLAVIKLRNVVPDHAQSFRIPGGYIVPVAACLAILWFLSHLTGREAIALLILVLILTAVFFLKRFVEAKTAEPVRKKEIISEPGES
ncbi:APC family permease [Rhodohalobacter sp. 8-1]|uniref:APC family permease n=1 Tax=Rhodohalobacter sp. 8-1 TaxID=3131972 RepID=UPI0030EF41D9